MVEDEEEYTIIDTEEAELVKALLEDPNALTVIKKLYENNGLEHETLRELVPDPNSLEQTIALLIKAGLIDSGFVWVSDEKNDDENDGEEECPLSFTVVFRFLYFDKIFSLSIDFAPIETIGKKSVESVVFFLFHTHFGAIRCIFDEVITHNLFGFFTADFYGRKVHAVGRKNLPRIFAFSRRKFGFTHCNISQQTDRNDGAVAQIVFAVLSVFIFAGDGFVVSVILDNIQHEI